MTILASGIDTYCHSTILFLDLELYGKIVFVKVNLGKKYIFTEVYQTFCILLIFIYYFITNSVATGITQYAYW